jgi:hypothetical protein
LWFKCISVPLRVAICLCASQRGDKIDKILEVDCKLIGGLNLSRYVDELAAEDNIAFFVSIRDIESINGDA